MSYEEKSTKQVFVCKSNKKIKRVCCMQNKDVLRRELHGALFGRFYYL